MKKTQLTVKEKCVCLGLGGLLGKIVIHAQELRILKSLGFEDP